MGIDAKHPSLEAIEHQYKTTSDFVDGEDEVKGRGVTYLPKLSGQTDAEYQALKNRAIFFPVTSKTCAGLLGAVFYKEPEVSLPTRIDYLKAKASVTGASMSDLAVQLVKGMLEYGRVGLFVDRPADGGAPYLVVYDGDDITNWDLTGTDKFVVLEEEIFARDPKDKYTLVEKEQYRELTFDADGNYTVNVWQEVKDPKTRKEKWVIVETSQPTKAGRLIRDLPFACATPDGMTFEVVKPPLYDLAAVNLKHYMFSASYSDAVHTVCFPTPYISGDIDNSDGKLTFNLGAKSAWVLPLGSTTGFVEVDGKSLDHADRCSVSSPKSFKLNQQCCPLSLTQLPREPYGIPATSFLL